LVIVIPPPGLTTPADDGAPLPAALVRVRDAWSHGAAINPSANFLSYSQGGGRFG